MAYVNPSWLEGRRRYWERHDAHRFRKPDGSEYRSYATRLIAQRQAEEEEARAAAEQEALRESLVWLRRELPEVKFELAFRRIFHKYRADQPCAPMGDPRGGQWTKEGGGDAGRDGGGRNDPFVVSDAVSVGGTDARFAAGRPRGSVVVRIANRTVELEGGQAARFAKAQSSADAAIARVRELDRNWRPTPSFSETVEGQISAYRGEAREAEARLSELAKIGVGPGPHAGESIPARGSNRSFTEAERTEINRIGSLTGCHTCGTQLPGTRSGNFVCDHQDPIGLNTSGRPMRLYPQCVGCSLGQGGAVLNLLRNR